MSEPWRDPATGRLLPGVKRTGFYDNRESPTSAKDYAKQVKTALRQRVDPDTVVEWMVKLAEKSVAQGSARGLGLVLAYLIGVPGDNDEGDEAVQRMIKLLQAEHEKQRREQWHLPDDVSQLNP